ncbi:MAG: hypothetical protein AABM42_10035 [Actinomycetota bacterium]
MNVLVARHRAADEPVDRDVIAGQRLPVFGRGDLLEDVRRPRLTQGSAKGITPRRSAQGFTWLLRLPLLEIAVEDALLPLVLGELSEVVALFARREG